MGSYLPANLRLCYRWRSVISCFKLRFRTSVGLETPARDAKSAYADDKIQFEIYDLIHYFRLGLRQKQTQPRTPGLLAGTLGDAFFEPLPEEELQQWE